MGNALSKERSLYLQQHAGNPVDWRPYGAAAFAEAAGRDVPVLISIGYSSCHWCHVMERECFEDPYIAGLMNTHFVCVKVDREERPDVDSVYMEAVQMIQGHGGWPLNVFCLPDGRPFFGGTYFPPEDRGNGMIPWPQLLMRIADYFKRRRAELEENAGNILANLEVISEAKAEGDAPVWSPALLLDAARVLLQNFDPENGGFGGAPKFPPSMALEFLVAVRTARAVDGDAHLAPVIDHAVGFTLETMVRSGLFDQVGGGFFRYCVDASWTIPHFEKMLYDNGLLLSALARGAAGKRGVELYRVAAAATLSWLEREMRGAEPDGSGMFGGFASALDADSPGGEGRFYCWTPEEVAEAGAKAGIALPEGWARLLGVDRGGNFEHGWSHLSFRNGDLETWEGLAALRTVLLSARETRGRPSLDPKRIAGWNALAARGIADAAYVFGEATWYRTARETIDWIESFFSGSDDLLRSVGYPDGVVREEIFLEDQVFAVEALLAVARAAARFEPEDVVALQRRAAKRMRVVLDTFDDRKAGLASTPITVKPPLIRKREWYDNAVPSGNSSALVGRLSLAVLEPGEDWSWGIAEIRDIYAAWAGRMPNGIGHALAGLAAEAIGIVVVKARESGDLKAVADRLAAGIWRDVHYRLDPDLPGCFQVCIGTTCLEAMETVAEVETAVLGKV